jgi:uncharacterized protein (DUF58 family)
VIVPDLAELVAMRAATAGLRLVSRRTARALHAGSHRSIQRGRGLEFQEVRPYVNGDDPRTIDWRVTARRGRPHTKLFREERERPVWLLVDLSPAMFFGTRKQLKSAVVTRAAALLAWTAAGGGDRVGAAIVDGANYKIIPPRARENGVLSVLAALVDMQPTKPALAAAVSLDDGLSALVPVVHPGSLILTLSDFAVLDTNTHSAWASLAVHNEFQLFRVTDPLEREALPNGRYRVGVRGRAVTIDGARSRTAWLAKWHERNTRIEALARRLGAPVTDLDTSQPVTEPLRAVLAGKRSAA